MPTLVDQINIAVMTFSNQLSRLTWAMAAVACLAFSSDVHAQRSGSKSANVELTNIPTLKRVVARNNSLTSVPEGMELVPELKVIDLKGNPFDDGAKVSTIRRFGEDIKIKLD